MNRALQMECPATADTVIPLIDAGALPRIGSTWADVLNLVLRWNTGVRLPLRGGDVDLTPRHGSGAAAATRWPFPFRLGQARGALWLQTPVLAHLCQDPTPEQLPADLRVLLVVDALASLVSAWEAASGAEFAWDDPSDPTSTPDDGPSIVLDVTLRSPETDAAVRIGSACLTLDPPDALRPVLERLAPPALPPEEPAWIKALDWPLSFEIGRTTLPLRELKTITRGDIITIDQWSTSEGDLQAPICCGRHRWSRLRVRLKEDRATLLPWKDTLMEDKTDGLPTDADTALDTAPIALDDLEVTLGFEIGHHRLTMAQLRELRPGHLFQLDEPLARSTVRILAHGRPIATGTLVAIGEHLGVRVGERADQERDPT